MQSQQRSPKMALQSLCVGEEISGTVGTPRTLRIYLHTSGARAPCKSGEVGGGGWERGKAELRLTSSDEHREKSWELTFIWRGSRSLQHTHTDTHSITTTQVEMQAQLVFQLINEPVNTSDLLCCAQPTVKQTQLIPHTLSINQTTHY